MRRPVQIALAAVVVLLLGTSIVLFSKFKNTSGALEDMKVAEQAAQSRYAETINAIAEIQDSLNAISVGDPTVQMLSRKLETEQKLTGASGREALDRIAVLRAIVLRSKARIRQLESSLKVSGNKIAGLQKMVTNLKKSVDEKEQLMTQLSSQVDALQTQVTGLTTAVQQTQDTLQARNQTLEERRRELATIYYAIGTRKDLSTAGVIVAKGGVLGLGKTLQPSGLTSETAFTALDTDQQTVVPIPSAKAKVLSAQPPTSYELKPVEGKLELHILDPREFRKVKQLVIVTA